MNCFISGKPILLIKIKKEETNRFVVNLNKILTDDYISKINLL